MKIFSDPDKLTETEFEQVSKLVEALPKDSENESQRENIESLLRGALEPLRPAAWAGSKDEEATVFWESLIKRSSPPGAYASVLAERLKFIACVAEGGPYVARGILSRPRLIELGGFGAKVATALEIASEGDSHLCLGAAGPRKEDFAGKCVHKEQWVPCL
jgi:hypothetical protein